MNGTLWLLLGLLVVGTPLVTVYYWPVRIPPGRSVDAIRQRIEREDRRRRHYR